jgi:LysM repeat protein
MVAALVLYAACNSGESEEAATGTPVKAAPRTPTPTPTFPNADVTYTVAEGDTLYDIAELYGVTVEAIVAANHLPDAAAISIGQVLIIPDAAYTPAATARR